MTNDVRRGEAPAHGFKDRRWRVELTAYTLRLPDEMFAEIRLRALKNEVSFREEVLTLLEWALEDHADASCQI